MAELYRTLERERPGSLVLDASKTVWFAASVCPALAAVLARAGYLDRTTIANVRDRVQNALARTGFMDRFGYSSVHDGYGSAVAYAEFDPSDGSGFARYVEVEVLGRSQMPTIAESTRLVVEQSIHEIRENADLHSGARQFLAGGQFYPNLRELCVTFADPGIGIPGKVESFLGQHLSGTEAIRWALEPDTTTRTREGRVPGGIGLHRIHEFMRANGGRLLIVSGNGLVLDSDVRQHEQLLPVEYPGTVMMLEINTSRETHVSSDEDLEVVF